MNTVIAQCYIQCGYGALSAIERPIPAVEPTRVWHRFGHTEAEPEVKLSDRIESMRIWNSFEHADTVTVHHAGDSGRIHML